MSSAEYTGRGSTTGFCGKDGKILLKTSLLIVNAGAWRKWEHCWIKFAIVLFIGNKKTVSWLTYPTKFIFCNTVAVVLACFTMFSSSLSTVRANRMELNPAKIQHQQKWYQNDNKQFTRQQILLATYCQSSFISMKNKGEGGIFNPSWKELVDRNLSNLPSFFVCSHSFRPWMDWGSLRTEHIAHRLGQVHKPGPFQPESGKPVNWSLTSFPPPHPPVNT